LIQWCCVFRGLRERRREWLRVEANAVVSIDVIDAGGRLAQPHLSGIRIADADLFA
jgi:hypothetical protein